MYALTESGLLHSSHFAQQASLFHAVAACMKFHAFYIGPWYVLGVLYPLFLMLCFLCLILAEGVAFVFRIWLCFAYRRDAQTTTSKGDVSL